MIINGKEIAGALLSELKERVTALKKKRKTTPGLATVLVGEDPASHIYVKQKIQKCEDCGMISIHKPLSSHVSQSDLLTIIEELNENPGVHSILVQLPLPSHLNQDQIIGAIAPHKDADGLHPLNQGLLSRMKSWKEIEQSGIPLPCTPYGIIHMILKEKIEVAGKHVVVVGRSTLVGKPVSQLFLSLDATVTIAHSRTKNLSDVCRLADILVAAIGQPKAIGKNAVKNGAVVIDVGISRTSQGIVGDVDFESVKDVASRITPVPGGVGPMTVAMLLKNTVTAAEKASKLSF